MSQRDQRKVNAAGKVKSYERNPATGRNLAHKWVNENGGETLWKLIPEKLRERLGLALVAGTVSDCEKDVRESRSRLERDLILLSHARDRDAILADVRKELDAFRALIDGTSSRMTGDARRTNVEEGSETS